MRQSRDQLALFERSTPHNLCGYPVICVECVRAAEPCRACVYKVLQLADERGDGAAVNALCWYGRSRFGPGVAW